MSTYERATTRAALTPEALGAALAATPGAHDWQVDTLEEEDTQVYLIGDRVEERRAVTNERARVIVYNDHASAAGDVGEQARGIAALTLLTSDTADRERLAERLTEAVAMARLTDNQPFDLPGMPASGFPLVQTVDPALEQDTVAALDATMARAQAFLSRWGSVRLSSAELFATRSRRAFRNSRGLTGYTTGTRVFFDFVLIARKDGREAEFHAEIQRRRLADLEVEGTLAAYATFALHALHATMPATHRGPVILSGEALSSLLTPSSLQSGPLVYHTSAEAAYQQLSRLAAGQPFTGEPPRGDRLTVISDGTRPWGVNTAPFSADGLPAARMVLIEDGIFRRPWADARYGAYTGIVPTGGFANLTILPGLWPLGALRSASDGPVYEIASFSWMNPDRVSGDFVAEIKLGYRHDAHGTTPIKGGSLSGNVFTAMADVRLASETYSDGNYYGPAAMRFGELTIAGA